jgi:hypothetical protein
LLTARHAVERAEWRTMGNDILGAIEARKNVIALEEAKRRLEQLERDIESRASSAAADLQVQEAARSKAMLEMNAARQLIDNFVVRTPVSGVVVLGENLSALQASADGVIYITEAGIPRFSQGDQTSSGSMIAQIQAWERMEIAANVLETEVSSMEPGQAVKVRLDTDPLRVYEGKLKSVAESSRPSASSSDLNYLEALSSRSFAAVFEVIAADNSAPIYPGVTAKIIIPGKSADDVLSVPRHALNQKAGEAFVYVRSGDGWKPQTVRVQYLTESRAVIEGVDEGMDVALDDPEKEKKKAKAFGKRISVITSEASS